MNSVVGNLLALQKRVLQRKNHSAEQEKEVDALRKNVPESVLIQFDRWMARGRKAVAVVNNGVCGECHLRLTVGIMGALAFGDEIQRCGNCGRFLYLPEDEPVSSPPPTPPAPPATRRRLRKRVSSHGR
jgi:predicted  nucleic acid-binding Zn-ribbon protein